MTIETRKHLSLAAVLASVVCAVFLIASALAAAGAQTSNAHNWQRVECGSPAGSAN